MVNIHGEASVLWPERVSYSHAPLPLRSGEADVSFVGGCEAKGRRDQRDPPLASLGAVCHWIIPPSVPVLGNPPPEPATKIQHALKKPKPFRRDPKDDNGARSPSYPDPSQTAISTLPAYPPGTTGSCFPAWQR